MHRYRVYVIAAILTLGIMVVFILLGRLPEVRLPEEPPETFLEVQPVGDEPIQPIPLQLDLDPRKVALGRALFLDGRLSADNTVACDSCHKLNLGGVDRLDISRGIHGRVGTANAPTVLNSGFNASQFWNGRAATLEEQIEGPVHSIFEMASSWPEVTAKLRADANISASFAAIYDDITAENIKDAIATFERSLYTPNSPFDRWLRGDEDALTPEELDGYRLFKERGCAGCHYSVNVGGTSFARFGLVHDYFAHRSEISDTDLGRFVITGREEDRHVFKVPGLRNVELTGPYFHDASARSLDQAVALMGYYQNGQPLPWREVRLITEFLRTLTGELDGIRLIDSIPLPPQRNLETLSESERGAYLFGAYCASCHSASGYTWGGLVLDAASLAQYATPQAILDAARAPEHPILLSALETHEVDAVAIFLWEESGRSSSTGLGKSRSLQKPAGMALSGGLQSTLRNRPIPYGATVVSAEMAIALAAYLDGFRRRVWPIRTNYQLSVGLKWRSLLADAIMF